MNVEKRFKNNDLKVFFAENGKFDDQILGKFVKYDYHHKDFFKHHSYPKFNADFNAKKMFLISHILSY